MFCSRWCNVHWWWWCCQVMMTVCTLVVLVVLTGPVGLEGTLTESSTELKWRRTILKGVSCPVHVFTSTDVCFHVKLYVSIFYCVFVLAHEWIACTGQMIIDLTFMLCILLSCVIFNNVQTQWNFNQVNDVCHLVAHHYFQKRETNEHI